VVLPGIPGSTTAADAASAPVTIAANHLRCFALRVILDSSFPGHTDVPPTGRR